jgi:hypothetical protein
MNKNRISQIFDLVRNELNVQLETYENKLAGSTKLVEEFKRENAKTVRLSFYRSKTNMKDILE